jgi:hypothetical protein
VLTAVYYPYFLPPVGWAKTAALCWDQVTLVAPRTVSPHRNSWEQELLDLDETLGGFFDQVDWIHPSPAAEADFESWVVDWARKGAASSATGWMTLFDEKFRPESDLLEKLRRMNLARATDGSSATDAAPRIDVRKDIAFGYIALCGEEWAASAGADLAADGEIFTEPLMYRRQSVFGDVAHAVLEAYLPKDAGALDPSRIAEVRSDLRVGRLKYQAEVDALVKQFGHLASGSDLQRVQDDIVEIATERVEETRRSYSRAKLEVGLKAMSVSLAPPAVASFLASSLGLAIFPPAGLALVLGLTGLKLLADVEAAQDDRSASGWSFVLDSAQLLSR